MLVADYDIYADALEHAADDTQWEGVVNDIVSQAVARDATAAQLFGLYDVCWSYARSVENEEALSRAFRQFADILKQSILAN